MHLLASTYRREESSLYWKRKLGSIAYAWPNGSQLGKNIKCEGFLQVQSSSGIVCQGHRMWLLWCKQKQMLPLGKTAGTATEEPNNWCPA